jgi:hypothetical protein
MQVHVPFRTVRTPNMCTSLAEGGQRCAAHTRPRYQTAQFGTADWDEAAAAYASTPTGRVELASSLAAAEAAGDINSIVAFEHAISEGQRMREKTALFREALTEQTTPTLSAQINDTAPIIEEPASQPDDAYDFENDDDYDGGTEYGGYAYVDEEAWESSPDRGWSPTMSSQTWDRNAPVFSGCTPDMTSNQFIDQVCDNTGITRAEFESAAAEYMARNGFHLELPNGNTRSLSGTYLQVGADSEALRYLIAGNGAPRFTPAQIAEIAEMARQRREPAKAPAAEAATAASTPAATSRRRPAIELPDDPAELTRLSTSDDNATRAAVAAHASTPADVLARMATSDAKPEVRAAAARNENLPVTTLSNLVTDRSIKVRAGAARNPNMPVAHLVTLSTDANATVAGAVARNPSTPLTVYGSLVTDASATVRTHAARRRDLPPAAAEALAADADSKVRAAVAKNWSTSPELLRRLADNPEQSVRANAAKNPNLPPALLRGRLSRDPAPGVRAAVARNNNTSTATLTRLSSDNDPWVRRNVAWNQNTPAALLYVLANDSDDGVRASASNRTADAA